MRAKDSNLEHFQRSIFSRTAVIAVALIVGLPAVAMAQEPGQKTYPSAEEASQALFAAASKNDQKAMLEVLGKDGSKIIQSGDPKEDEEARNNFIQKFQVMHRLVEEPDATTTLYIGAENWPMTIPLVNRVGKWYFDTDAARQEIVFRRVGKNELSAIRVCAELAAAQKNYFAKNNEYAEKFVSDDGKQNGLYWPTTGTTGTAGESPIGPLVANAGSLSGLTMDSGAEPFRGYFFRILNRQGGKASGGSLNYVGNGKMTKGFAFVAYPAVYRDSGVMTFIISQDGVVYEKDLGKQTVEKAKAMKSYDPDQSWKKSDEPEQSAANQKPE
jgi:hypothetical protein